MTVVAAVARAGEVVIAADRQTNYQNQTTWGARKVRRITVRVEAGKGERREALLAVAGHGGGLATVLPRARELPAMPVTEVEGELDDWADAMACVLTTALAGLQPPLLAGDGDGMQSAGADYLLGAEGRLWHLFTHSASRAVDGIAAIGVGSEVALGAMHVAMSTGHGPHSAATIAVNLACRLAPWCSLGPTGMPLVEILGGDGGRSSR